ncbi:hypothetical protein LCGC14_0270760 [marine sediment metagenome]|jgi:putative toxin-antitoxin system antitoxin component (TIGR02293 family)|uniref:Antitoxin Xre/MbcA/ParS-like toxin-binding domain-containing protein n=1 Tax=marine sediment metagenome TaxID=412755 RepID=A0A0F9UFQ7_9ZZZZ
MQAAIHAQAIRVLGSPEAAQTWMQTPVIGLTDQRPAELLETDNGAQQVADHLTRIEYGVYT